MLNAYSKNYQARHRARNGMPAAVVSRNEIRLATDSETRAITVISGKFGKWPFLEVWFPVTQKTRWQMLCDEVAAG